MANLTVSLDGGTPEERKLVRTALKEFDTWEGSVDIGLKRAGERWRILHAWAHPSTVSAGGPVRMPEPPSDCSSNVRGTLRAAGIVVVE